MASSGHLPRWPGRYDHALYRENRRCQQNRPDDQRALLSIAMAPVRPEKAIFTAASDEGQVEGGCAESGCVDLDDGVKWAKSGLAKSPGEVA